MSLSRLLHRPSLSDKVIVGEYRIDLEADCIAEKQLSTKFPDVQIISSVEGRKLIPIQEIIKIEQKLSDEKEKEYKKGLVEGRLQGKNEGYAEAKKVIDNFSSLIKDAIKQREVLYNEAGREIPELIIQIAKKITFGAVQIDPNVTIEMVYGTIKKLVDRSKIKVKVHPEHLQLVEQQISRFKGESGGIKEITIEADSRVRFGGCFIETPTGNFDARLDSQFEIIAEALKEAEGDL